MARKHVLNQNMVGIITGASTGIGRALAISLAQKFSARLVLNSRNEQLLNETAEYVRKAGGQAVCIAGDISDKETANKLIQACLSNFGSVDLLVNNAGYAKPGSVMRLSPDDWHDVFAVNFFGCLYACYAALPIMVKQGSGKIVNIASVAGKVAFPGSVCYSASKFALTGMSEGMASEFAAKGLDIITVCPGWVRTEFFANSHYGQKNDPTAIAEKKNLQGWIMRNVLSISPVQTANEIIKSCQKGGSSEIVLTAPGILIERLAALFPNMVFTLLAKFLGNRLAGKTDKC